MANSKSKKEWREATLQPALKKSPPREPKFETTSGIVLDDTYAPEDIANLNYDEALGYPGEFPYTRGVQPTMYRGRFWTMRQYAGFADAEESNRRYRYLLEQGQTGLSVAFDLPTQLGYDSDHDFSEGEVGKVGVAISSLEDMETLFKEIPLDKVSTSMTINATAAIILAMYVAVGKQQGVPIAKLSGTVQNDVLKEYVARGTYIFPPRPSMRLITDSFKYCTDTLPRWNTISISGYHIREAGANAVQEVAFTMANAIAYAQAAIDTGLDVDAFAGQLSFFFASHNNLFEEVAKFRAARRIWAKIMRDRFKAKDARSWMLRFHTQTGGSTLTAQQPQNNIIRTAMQALSAVLGSTQSLHTNSWDEALSLPSEQSVQLALRTQQVIAYETGVADIVDPLAGSYLVERLTDEIEERVQEYLNKIERMGGALAAIENGFMQYEIQDSAYRYQQDIENLKRTVVGVNRFTVPEPRPTGLLKVDPLVRQRQSERLASLRSRRDSAQVAKLLARLEEVARGTENTLPPIVECVESYATLGEICEVLRKVFGEQKGTVAL
ncbi:MAG: methylmalonyl-CoA mutase family protein [Dehalococcoidia bacterium]|nr:methylmalonyl-CoA mutase family protein [Dehalococcoidia bacterium]